MSQLKDHPTLPAESSHDRTASEDVSTRETPSFYKLSQLYRYGFAILVTAAALLITLPIELIATKTPFALFFAAVVVGSWYGGRYPGLLVLLLSTLLSARFLIPPYSLLPSYEGALQLGVFILVGFAISWLATARAESERSRRLSEERYRLLFESNPIAMWVYDFETLRFLEVNDAAVHQYGYSRDEFLSMTIKNIREPDELPKLMDEMSRVLSPLGTTNVWKHRKKDGTIIDAEITAHTMEFKGRPARLVLSSDVTERRTLEEQLRQSQKMEAIGILAGGVAHDFNNLLTAIAGYSELALRKLQADDPVRSNIQEVLNSAKRAAGLTSQLLAFSRKQVLQPKIFNLNPVVSEMEKMLRRLIGERTELKTVLDPALGNVKADPGQVEQIVMNLVVNAHDAMPEGGKLTIETKNVYLNEDYTKMHITVKPGPYVMMAVSDTGEGMDENTQKRVFEPFFSTKGPGKGTGLGLSTTYGIVKQSGGNIWIYSEVGKGTTFKIYLPLAEGDSQRAETPAKSEEVLHGSETIILCEDEEIVRSLAREVLKLYGYNVLEAATGKEALKICERSDNHIDLLITDVIMPEMSGRELADRVAAQCPNIKVLYMSGYTDSAIVHQGVLDENAHFIQKPFSAEALARKVREVVS